MATVTYASARTDDQILIDGSDRLQTWEGWGTSLAWWAHVVGSYPEPLRTELVDKAIGGLKLNIVRYNIGGGEAPGLEFMEPRARVPGFLSADGTYDWNADPAQRWVLDRAVDLGADRFEAFSNSPPYFMTISGSATGGADGKDNLRPECLGAFTRYLATVVKEFRDRFGIEFRTLDPMNEPAAHWWKYGNRQEGCRFSPGEPQSELILATQRSLRSAGLTTQISACDESWTDWTTTSWDALSAEAKRCIYRLNTHCYGGTSDRQVNERATSDQKQLWMSEYGDGDETGMQLAHRIVLDLREMKPTAWVYWQVVDHGGWGCLDVDLNAAAKVYQVNRKYYAFAQFTRFIREQARFLSISDTDSVCALKDKTLVIVSVSDTDRNATYDLSRFHRVGRSATVYRTSPSEDLTRLESIPIHGGRFSASLPAHSVTTFVIEGTDGTL